MTIFSGQSLLQLTSGTEGEEEKEKGSESSYQMHSSCLFVQGFNEEERAQREWGWVGSASNRDLYGYILRKSQPHNVSKETKERTTEKEDGTDALSYI